MSAISTYLGRNDGTSSQMDPDVRWLNSDSEIAARDWESITGELSSPASDLQLTTPLPRILGQVPTEL